MLLSRSVLECLGSDRVALGLNDAWLNTFGNLRPVVLPAAQVQFVTCIKKVVVVLHAAVAAKLAATAAAGLSAELQHANEAKGDEQCETVKAELFSCCCCCFFCQPLPFFLFCCFF